MEFEDSKFKSLLGIEKNWLKLESERQKNKRSSVGIMKQLIIFFFWLRYYLPERVLGLIFNCSKSTIRRLCSDMVDHYFFKWKNKIYPSVNKTRKLLGREFCYIIDGSEQEILHSKYTMIECLSYSAKKAQNSISILLIVNLEGKIVWISESYFGSNRDSDIFIKEQLRISKVFKNNMLVGDAGFAGFDNVLTIGRKNPNFREFSSIRCIVEQTIGKIKKYAITSSTLRIHPTHQSLELHQRCWTIVSCLVNKFYLSDLAT